MENKLASFAELVKTARKEKDLLVEHSRKEVAPLLAEYFQVVATAKQPTQSVQVAPEVEIPKPVAHVPETNISDIVKKLQNDIANLKRYVDTKTVGSIYSTAGSGEVRVLRMDDVDPTGITQDSVLAYNESSKDFSPYQFYDKVFSNVINKPTTINEDMSYSVIGYLKIHNTLHVKGNLGIR